MSRLPEFAVWMAFAAFILRRRGDNFLEGLR